MFFARNSFEFRVSTKPLWRTDPGVLVAGEKTHGENLAGWNSFILLPSFSKLIRILNN